MMTMLRNSLRMASLSALLLAGCSNAAVPAEKANEPRLATFGYRDIKLGSSLEDTLKKIDTSFYRPEDIANCLMGMPAKGCMLIWNNWAFPYVRKNGIPYQLNLSFDQWDRLTRISLDFSRRDNDIDRNQCL